MPQPKAAMRYCCGWHSPIKKNWGAPMMRYEIYRTYWRKEFRWRFVANGRIIAQSSEGYKNYIDCLRGIELMQRSGEVAVHVDY